MVGGESRSPGPAHLRRDRVPVSESARAAGTGSRAAATATGRATFRARLSSTSSKSCRTVTPASVHDAAARRAAEKLGAAGVGADSRVVAYSAGSVMWATRLWWMLRSLGFDRVAVLDGGFGKWRREDRPVTREVSTYPPARMPISPRPSLWADLSEMRQVAAEGRTCTINALSPDVYSGEKNVYGRPGHIPGSHNVFYDSSPRSRSRGSSSRSTSCENASRAPARSRARESSPIAAAVSPRRWTLSRSRCSATRTSRSTTARCRSGRGTPSFR